MPLFAQKPTDQLITKQLKSEYANEQEDASFFRGSPQRYPIAGGAGFTEKVTTRYFTKAEQKQARLRVGKRKYKGLLLDRQAAKIDTSDASGKGTFEVNGENTGKGKFIYAMTPQGQIRIGDPNRMYDKLPLGPAGDDGRTPYNLRLANHSTLVGGGDVAAAGEMQVNDGKLIQLGDTSGHYRPDNQMTYQAAARLEQMGVDMSDVTMRLCAKSDGERSMLTSAAEFMGYGGAANAEEKMRAFRRDMQVDLSQEIAARAARRAGGVGRERGEDVALSDKLKQLYGTPDPSAKVDPVESALPVNQKSLYTIPPAQGDGRAEGGAVMSATPLPGPAAQGNAIKGRYIAPPARDDGRAEGGAVVRTAPLPSPAAQGNALDGGYALPSARDDGRAEGGAVVSAAPASSSAPQREESSSEEEEEEEAEAEAETGAATQRRFPARVAHRLMSLFSRFGA